MNLWLTTQVPHISASTRNSKGMTMDNVTFITVDDIEHAIIDHGNGEFTSMLKSTYEAQQAEQSTLGLVNSDNPVEPVV